MEAGQIARAVLNTLLSVVLCVAAAALGVMLARQI
jgi:fluoride ion exporter CrcB/FEX